MKCKPLFNTPFLRTLVTVVVVTSLPGLNASVGADRAADGVGDGPVSTPQLVGRAVLPAVTLAGGPPSGAGAVSANGVTFPLPSQPVQGFSAIIDGRYRGELLAMPDNGYGGKANSRDFLIRAYYIQPDFKTAAGGSGSVAVGEYIEFRDPDGVIGFPIVREGTVDRLLTGGDIDPESLQRDHKGDLWVGDEFGPWILHFDATGRLLDPPFELPGGLRSPNNPFLGAAAATQPNSRGLEAMAMSPSGKYLYAVLEGAPLTDTDQLRRTIFEFSIKREVFTGRTWQYHVESSTNLVSDIAATGRNEFLVIERDGGRGLMATFRTVYAIDLRDVDAEGFVVKQAVVDLTKIPDPDLVSLPEIHSGDLGLGDPFWVMCESVEAIHVVRHDQVVIGCDNNLPNTGRNPARADDSELIVVDVPRVR